MDSLWHIFSNKYPWDREQWRGKGISINILWDKLICEAVQSQAQGSLNYCCNSEVAHSTECGYDQSYICLNPLFIVSRPFWHHLWYLVRHLSAEKMISVLITADGLLSIFRIARAMTEEYLSTTSLCSCIELSPRSTEVETISVLDNSGKGLEELQENADMSILKGWRSKRLISTDEESSNKHTWSGRTQSVHTD